MKFRAFFGSLLLALSLLSAKGASADLASEDTLPHLQLLACSTACLDFIPAKTTKYVPVKYPSGQVGRNGIGEGFVWLRYTIGTDGTAHDISRIYSLGDDSFVQNSMDALADRTFSPASINGKPTPQTVTARFRFGGTEAASEQVTNSSKTAQALMDSGNDQEAQKILDNALNSSRLSYADRSTLALPLAKLAIKRNDYLRARRFLLMATEYGTGNVPPEVQADLWATRINVDLSLGEYSDAFGTFQFLTTIPTLNPGVQQRERLDKIRAETDAKPQIVTRATIPNDAEGAVYWHGLYRRNFQFAIASGQLDKFTLTCTQSSMDSKISLTAMWQVPLSWSNCILFVSGTPGTVFNIIETQETREQADQQLARLKAAIEADPENSEAWLMRARALASFRRFKDAIADYSKAIELSPELLAAYLGRSEANAAISNYPSALADDEAALLLDPKNAQTKASWATLLLAIGRCDDGATAFSNINNKNWRGHYIEGVGFFCAGKYPEAELEFKKATDGAADFGLEVYVWLDIVRRKLGEDSLLVVPRSNLAFESWIPQIANLYAGRTTIEKVEAVMKGTDAEPGGRNGWPCGVRFFLGEFRLINGDLAGARTDFGALSPSNCQDVEAAAATAELKRLPPN